MPKTGFGALFVFLHIQTAFLVITVSVYRNKCMMTKQYMEKAQISKLLTKAKSITSLWK